MMFWFVVLDVTVAIIRQVSHLLICQYGGSVTIKL